MLQRSGQQMISSNSPRNSPRKRPLLGDGWKAALVGDSKRVEELLEANHFEIDSLHPVSGQSALHLACLQGHETVVGLLLRRGAEMDLRDSVLGETALHKAVMGDHARIVQMLTSVGASKHILSRKGLTAMDIAKRKHNRAIVGFLGDEAPDKARRRGKSLVASLLEATMAHEEKESIILDDSEEADPEIDYIDEMRRMEKRYQMVHTHLSHAKREKEVHEESYNNAIELLGSKELEIEEFKRMVTRMQKDLDHERSLVHRLQKQLDEKRSESKAGERLAREIRELQRKLEYENSRRVEEKRIFDREKEKNEDKMNQQHANVLRLQKQIVSLETEHETHVEKLERESKEFQDLHSEAVLQLQKKSSDVKDSTKRVDELLNALEKETAARRERDEDYKQAQEEIRTTKREVKKLRRLLQEKQQELLNERRSDNGIDTDVTETDGDEEVQPSRASRRKVRKSSPKRPKRLSKKHSSGKSL